MTHQKTYLIKDFGNVTEETEVTFEYQVKQIRELVLMQDLDLTKVEKFPF